jgi:hypothetical protein
VPFKFDTSSGHYEMAPDLNVPGPTIANNINYQAVLQANRWVDTVTFHFTNFSLLEENGDILKFRADKEYTLFGAPLNTSPIGTLTPFANWQAGLQILTNEVKPSPGFAIDSATVKCLATPRTQAPDYALPLAPGIPTIGLLLGDGDTLFFRYKQSKLTTPAQNRLHVALNSTTTSRFYLYARCDALPSETSYIDAGEGSGGHNQFLDLPLSRCPSGLWFFAVNSATGGGEFNISVGEGFDVRFCVAFDETIPFTKAEKDASSDIFMQGMKAFYAANLGGPLFSEVGFTDKGRAGACNIDGSFVSVFAQFSKGCNRSDVKWDPSNKTASFMDLCTDSLRGYPNSVEWRGPLHEMGHMFWGFPDEYDVSSIPTLAMCGHSVMADLRLNGYCNHSNHARDGITGAPAYSEPQGDHSLRGSGPFGNDVSMEEKIQFYGSHTQLPQPTMSHSGDMENYAFQDFDFNASHPNTVTKIISYK